MTSTSASSVSAAPALGADVTAVLEREPFALAAPLAALTRDDLERMSSAEAEVVVAATQRLTSALAAIQVAAVTTVADRADVELDRYRADRRRDLEERRDAAEAAGRVFTERLHPIPGEGSFAAASLAPLLRISPRTMATRIRRARRMDHEMPGTWQSLRAGDLEPYRADAVVRASEVLEVADLSEFEARVYAEDVTDLSTGEIGTRARRAAAATNREAVEEVAERAKRKRGVSCGPDRDVPGLATWRVSMPSDVSARMWAAVDELGHEYLRGRRSAGDREVTLDQSRADALADLVLGRATVETTLELVVPVAALADTCVTAAAPGTSKPGSSAPGSGAPHRPVPSVGVHRPVERRTPAEVLRTRGKHDEMILSWVTGQDLHTASVLEAEYALQLMAPLEIEGNPHLTAHPPPAAPPSSPPHATASSPHTAPTGPAGHVGAWFVPGHVDARRVGALLPDTLARLIDDPATRLRIVGSDPVTGAVVTDATSAYRPHARLLSRVRRRDGTCRFPGCSTPAERTQLDHVTPWPHGPTSEDNLACLCTSHHGFKHHSGWRLALTPDGTCTWTAPTGRTHTTRPRAVHSTSV